MNEYQTSIELKITKAKALFSEVPVLLENNFNTTVINRLYYACFHATKALLLTKKLMPKTHKGVVVMLQQHFVLENLIDKKYGEFFSSLMEERMDDDYSDYLIVDSDTLNYYIDLAKEYIPLIESLIKHHEYQQ